ncbi:MAG: 16S rRNA (cytidine(1402)-2'-O)-methyltransferase [Clostridia bacterium]|nr:16S rRNA (cytidine(1402)-2'-O)-methyltransferase [Clostridia bacterium]
MAVEPGTLYLVGTPIGNLGDLSPRALEVLGEVDFVACEDTRVTGALLTRFGLRRPLVSYHEHNARGRGGQLVERLLAGESGALCTDAGMPAISDPGEDIVRLCHEAGVAVVAVPGPSAVTTALALAGLPTGRFCFEGFLPSAGRERAAHLAGLKGERRTMVLYEAPHRLKKTLKELLEALGDRPVALCREMTKLHEEVRRTTLSEAVAHYETNEPRGEFVLVLGGAPDEGGEAPGEADIEGTLRRLLGEGLSGRDAVRETVARLGVKKNLVYDCYTRLQQE